MKIFCTSSCPNAPHRLTCGISSWHLATTCRVGPICEPSGGEIGDLSEQNRETPSYRASSHVRLSSLHSNETLLPFVKQIAMYCIDLRIDNLNWMVAADLRRILSPFRLAVSFHSGNVALSKSTLVHDVKTLFPFLKYVHLLVSLDNVIFASSTRRQSALGDETFHGLCASLNTLPQLEHISLVLQEKKGRMLRRCLTASSVVLSGGCLSESSARVYFGLVCEYISTMQNSCTLVAVEENGHDIKDRFSPADTTESRSVGAVQISLPSTSKHSIVSFRPMPQTKLTLATVERALTPAILTTLVLPCVPAAWNDIDLHGLQILDIGCVDVSDREELLHLDELLHCHRDGSLRNLSISLNNWQLTRLAPRASTTTSASVGSIFENCFDQLTTPDSEDELGEPSSVHPSIDEEKVDVLLNAAQTSPCASQTSEPVVDELVLEFLDETPSPVFQLPLRLSWLAKLTNLNLTGIHCHSIDFKYLFASSSLLRSLSLSPCLLLYIDQTECHCQSSTSSNPYQIHALSPNLLSLNLVSHLSNVRDTCTQCLEQYRTHCIRYSSIHQHLKDDSAAFRYDSLASAVIQVILQTLDLQHLSIRMPNYELQPNDFVLQPDNHLQSLILDVKVPLSFYSRFARLFAVKRFGHLRRLLLVSKNSFQLTPMLIDRFRTLETVEILSTHYHLDRPTMQYLETVLKPADYPNLHTFRVWIGSVVAKHLLKHLHKTVRLAFGNTRPGFVFDVSIVERSAGTLQTRAFILYDRSHPVHQSFHSLLSTHSYQLSLSYPSHLNWKPLYSELKFDK